MRDDDDRIKYVTNRETIPGDREDFVTDLVWRNLMNFQQNLN